MQSEKQAFLESEEGRKNYNEKVEEVVEKEFAGRLRGSGQVAYLDHVGAALYSDAQVRACLEGDLLSGVYCNPHSASNELRTSPAVITATKVHEARELCAGWFNTSLSKHSVVFTANCTAALKLVGDCFEWTTQSSLYYLYDNHNSALGIREIAGLHTANILSSSSPDHFFSHVSSTLKTPAPANHLLVMSAQCNFSGVRTPFVEIIETLRSLESANNNNNPSQQPHHWYVLLDAACFVSHAKLDLSSCTADFVALSFYKMFGYPTGLGALIVRNTSAQALSHKHYFGGGTVSTSLASRRFHVMRDGVAERLEDGTVSFLSILALKHGFAALEHAHGTNPLDSIDKHTHSLASYTAQKLASLRHANGTKVCFLAGHYDLETGHSEASKQGPVVTFNLKRSDGSWVGPAWIGTLAGLSGIQLRSGCMCNPGACHRFVGLSEEEVIANAKAGKVCWLDDMDLINGKPTGAVRASFGYSSTWEDAQALVSFIKDNFVDLHNPQTNPFPKPPVNQLPATVMMKPVEPVVVSRIFLYPIKSCNAMEVSSWTINKETGALAYDRQWALQRASDGENVTQKIYPKLCYAQPSIDLKENVLRVSAKGHMENDLMLSLPADSETDIQKASEWFSELVGNNAKLVWTKATVNNTKKKTSSFLNTAGFLVLSQASLDDLQAKLPETAKDAIDIINFRPNLIIKGSSVEAYGEDKWKGFQVGPHMFAQHGLCNRCLITCVDKRSATITKEPLATLAKYRHIAGGLMFGALVNYVACSVAQDVWTVSVNQRVVVIEEGAPIVEACKAHVATTPAAVVTPVPVPASEQMWKNLEQGKHI